MKRRIYSSVLGGLLAAVTASACDGGSYSYGGGGYAAGSYCGQYASCGACTPVPGCGWCQTGLGKGMCADDPNDCAAAPAFSWTWNPSGCFPAIADASVAPAPDAATSVTPDSSSATVDAALPKGSTDAPAH